MVKVKVVCYCIINKARHFGKAFLFLGHIQNNKWGGGTKLIRPFLSLALGRMQLEFIDLDYKRSIPAELLTKSFS